jgi:hypothetical protein
VAPPAELRFLLGRAFGRVRAGFAGVLKLTEDQLGQFVAALLSLEVGSFVPPYDPATIEALAKRVQKLVGKKALRALGPYALEVAGTGFAPAAWAAAFEATAVRAGLVACGDPTAAIETALRLDGTWDVPEPPKNPAELRERIRESARCKEILTFAVSEDHFALRQQLGLSVSP